MLGLRRRIAAPSGSSGLRIRCPRSGARARARSRWRCSGLGSIASRRLGGPRGMLRRIRGGGCRPGVRSGCRALAPLWGLTVHGLRREQCSEKARRCQAPNRRERASWRHREPSWRSRREGRCARAVRWVGHRTRVTTDRSERSRAWVLGGAGHGEVRRRRRATLERPRGP